MYLIRGIQNIDLYLSKYKDVDLIATIGNFDGLHLGHQHIIKNMKKDAAQNNWKTLVIFTEPHAKEFFAEALGTEEEKPPRIFPWPEKVKRLKELGVEFSFFLNFNNQLRKMTPEDFISEVLSRLSIKKIVIGDDFRFGANREGDFNFLKSWGKENDILVENTETFEANGERVSSTRIRDSLIAGNFDDAKELLGKPYTFCGNVVYGQQLGEIFRFGVGLAPVERDGRIYIAPRAYNRRWISIENPPEWTLNFEAQSGFTGTGTGPPAFGIRATLGTLVDLANNRIPYSIIDGIAYLT